MVEIVPDSGVMRRLHDSLFCLVLFGTIKYQWVCSDIDLLWLYDGVLVDVLSGDGDHRLLLVLLVQPPDIWLAQSGLRRQRQGRDKEREREDRDRDREIYKKR